MTTVLDVPALQGPPDIGALLQMLSEGLADRRKNRKEETKRLLAQNIGGSLSSGDFQGAANTAFASGDMSSGLKIHELGIKQQAEMVDVISRHAASPATSTPEGWEAFISTLEKRFPGENIRDEWGPFENRQIAIDEALSVSDQLAQQAREESSARDNERLEMEQVRLRLAQEEAAQGTRQPPKSRHSLDDQGRTIFEEFQPDGTWKQLGGAKASTSKAVQPTERENRNRQLYMVMEPDLKIVTENFSSLYNILNQGGQKAPLISSYLTSSGFQRARNSLRAVVTSYLYSVSGQTANPGEVETLTDILTPKTGEKKASLEDKLNRIKIMVESVKQGRGSVDDELVAAPEDEGEEPIDENEVPQAFLDADMSEDDWRFVDEEDRDAWR